MDFIKTRGPGILAAVLLGGLCSAAAELHKGVDSLVLGLAAGMLSRALMDGKPAFIEGLERNVRFFIFVGIAFYGVQLKLRDLPLVPPIAWLQLIVGMIAIFPVALYAGRKLGLRDRSSLLIWAGTAICGASAIAIATPALRARKEDTSIALASITLWALSGMFLYPVIQDHLRLSEAGYALLTATTLHLTGAVKVAAAAGGPDCIDLALTIKLARTALLVFVVPFLSSLSARREAAQDARPRRRWVPPIMLVYVSVGALFSFAPGLAPLAEALVPLASLFFTIAMASIGLTVDVKAVAPAIPRGLGAALAAWLALIGVFAAGNGLIGY